MCVLAMFSITASRAQFGTSCWTGERRETQVSLSEGVWESGGLLSLMTWSA